MSSVNYVLHLFPVCSTASTPVLSNIQYAYSCNVHCCSASAMESGPISAAAVPVPLNSTLHHSNLRYTTMQRQEPQRLKPARWLLIQAQALRRVKSYLRSTMSQRRLNNIMVLHVHKNQTGQLSLIEVANGFVQWSDHRRHLFGKFLLTD